MVEAVILLGSWILSGLALFALIWLAVSISRVSYDLKYVESELQATKAAVESLAKRQYQPPVSLGTDDAIEAAIAERARERAKDLLEIMQREQEFISE